MSGGTGPAPREDARGASTVPVPVCPDPGTRQGDAEGRTALVERLAEVLQTQLREVAGLRCLQCRGTGLVTVECSDGQCTNPEHVSQRDCSGPAHRTIEQQDAVDAITAVLDLLESEGRLDETCGGAWLLLAYLLNQYDRVVELHAQVEMDTPEDKALHADAVEAMREAADPVRAALRREVPRG